MDSNAARSRSTLRFVDTIAVTVRPVRIVAEKTNLVQLPRCLAADNSSQSTTHAIIIII